MPEFLGTMMELGLDLKTAGGDWTKISGNYNMTGKKIVWGQDLGTNSKST